VGRGVETTRKKKDCLVEKSENPFCFCHGALSRGEEKREDEWETILKNKRGESGDPGQRRRHIPNQKEVGRVYIGKRRRRS